MSDLRLTSDIELQHGEDKVATFVGTAYTGAVVKANGFKLPVVVDLAGLTIPDKPVPVLRSHDHDKVVGHATVSKSDTDITIDGVVSGSNTHADEIVASSKKGMPWQLSIGSSILKTETLPKGKTTTVNGRPVHGPLLIARSSLLNEVSYVAVGADRQTSVHIAATAKTEEGKETMAFEDVAKEIEASNERVEALELIASKYKSPAVEKLLEAAIADESISADRFELECLRASRPTVSNRQTGGSKSVTGEVLEAGLCLSMGIEDAYDERTMQLAHNTFKGGIGIVELLQRGAEANGQRVSHRDIPGLLKANFGQTANFSGFSTLDVSGILSNVANKSAVSYFNSIEQAWRQIAKIGSVRDFKENSLYGITGASDTVYKPLAKGGEITHGQLSEYGYKVQASRFARMLAITEEDLINDDLGVLDSASSELGVGAAEALNELFWGVYTDDAAFYAAGNNNVQNDVLDADGLDALEQAFREQKKPNGQPLGVSPAILLVAPKLHNTALRLMNAMGVVGSSDREDINIFKGRYTVVTSDYLTGTNWYLLAAPVRPTAHVVFRDGVQTPRVERAMADFAQYGIQLRGCLDFGVSFGEPRFGQKSTGDAT